jgi:hypothetical protein
MLFWQSNALRPYLTCIRNTLTAAMCLQVSLIVLVRPLDSVYMTCMHLWNSDPPLFPVFRKALQYVPLQVGCMTCRFPRRSHVWMAL